MEESSEKHKRKGTKEIACLMVYKDGYRNRFSLRKRKRICFEIDKEETFMPGSPRWNHDYYVFGDYYKWQY